MKRFNLRGVTRNVKYILNSNNTKRRPFNYKSIAMSWFVSSLYSNTLLKKRPRNVNWLMGKNKF